MNRFKPTFMGAALAALVLTTTTALAGSGVGGVFNLGQTNTVNQKSTLTGATSDPELIVQNTGAGSALSLIGGAGAAPFKVNSTTKVGSLNADFLDGLDSAVLQKRVTGTCATGQAIRVVNATGTVSCQAVGGAGGSWSLSGNAGSTPGTNFLGTTDDNALELKVNKQRALRIEPNPQSPNLIGGFSENSVDPGFYGSVIAGGGSSGFPNHVANSYAAIGGGSSNTATGAFSAVAGGASNMASGHQSAVGGGASNTANGSLSAVGGGASNTASSFYSAVAGGLSNSASGQYSIVAGGDHNTASGLRSFSAGMLAVADDTGSFVWSDGVFNDGTGNAQIHSPGNNSFTAHATGGFNLWTHSSGAPTGCAIAAGGGTWVCTSSRTVKDEFAAVDRGQVLKRLATIPITTWHYKNEQGGARHIGPMAQDFARAFHFGHGNTGIAMVDADGVALTAIQGLYRQNQALQRQNQTFRSKLEAQNATLEAQSSRLARLEHAVSKLSP
jgi:hypothetical protein